MSSPRITKQFQAMPDQIKRLGSYSFDIGQVIRWQGRVAAGPNAGKDAALIDIDSAAWADNNRRVLLLAEPASDKNNTAAMKTQSHAQGHTLDGSVSLKMYVETPEAHTDAQAHFQRLVIQHLVGQLGAPVELFFGTNDVQPRLEGVDGASAGNETACGFVSAGVLLPWGMAVPGGI